MTVETRRPCPLPAVVPAAPAPWRVLAALACVLALPLAAAPTSAQGAAPGAARGPAAAASRAPGAMVTGEARLPEATLFYRESGAGRPALFVHALLIDSRLWLDQLRGLGDLRRCLAPDLSGFGFSSPIAGDKIDMARYADELLAYLDAMQIREPVDAVGLSAGGNILLLAYLKQPQRFRSAVLISTGVGGGALDPAGARYRAENARTVVIDGKDTLYRRFNEYIVSPNAPLFARARYKTMLEQTPYESLVAFLTTTTMTSPADLASRVRIPVMIPVGRDDTVFPVATAEKVARQFPDARVVTLESAGRLLPLEAPQALNAAIRDFWSTLDAAANKPSKTERTTP